eukprot:Nk52_evm2s380 gene=Nk52_evmTU2s380
MGNSTSKSPEFEKCWGNFTEEERMAIESFYPTGSNNCGTNPSARPGLSCEEFISLFSFPGAPSVDSATSDLIRDWFCFFAAAGDADKVLQTRSAVMGANGDDFMLLIDPFAIALSKLLYGDAEEKGSLFLQLSMEYTPQGKSMEPPSFSKSRLRSRVLPHFFSLCVCISSTCSKNMKIKTENCHTKELAEQFIFSIPADSQDSPSSYEIGRSIQKHCLFSTLFQDLLRYIFITRPSQTQSQYQDKSKTRFTFAKDISPTVSSRDRSYLLSRESVWFLNAHVPVELRSEWRRLFSSKEDGASFNSLVDSITGQGPLVMAIKDKNEHLFGAFVSGNLKLHCKFYGDTNCFLFSLNPEMRTYDPSGYNENYVFCSRGMETLPNGIGFGGQLEYFGLFISSDFDHGHSRGHPLSTTYNSPVLSASSDFEVVAIEVWGLGKPPEDLSKGRDRSALDTNPEAAEIMEMAGKKMYSKHLRKRESTDEEDES